MFGKRKRNLFKLNLRDKFSPIKHDKIKFHLFTTRGMREPCVNRIGTNEKYHLEISPFVRPVFKIIPAFISSRNFPFFPISSSRATPDRYFLRQIGILFQRIETMGEIWIEIFIPATRGYDRERLRVLIEFPASPDSNSTFISRERVIRGRRKGSQSVTDFTLLPTELQSISHPRDRDRISRIIEKRRERVSFARKLNSRSRRFISSGAAACRQLQLPNFIFRVFGHRETRDRLVKLD